RQRAIDLDDSQYKVRLHRDLSEGPLILLFQSLDRAREKIDAVLHDGVDDRADHGLENRRKKNAQNDLGCRLVDFRAAVQRDLAPIIVANSLRDIDDVAQRCGRASAQISAAVRLELFNNIKRSPGSGAGGRMLSALP